MKYKGISVLENIRCQYLWEIPRYQYFVKYQAARVVGNTKVSVLVGNTTVSVLVGNTNVSVLVGNTKVSVFVGNTKVSVLRLL